MGRRKIEIQPIQHDRNRSVTFLKRKNGLFKKAYELGVLCSVDVLVVVFGTNGKMFEYSSATNSETVLNRRVNYSGECEKRHPSDFSNLKGNDAGEDDGDDIEEIDSDDQKPIKPQPAPIKTSSSSSSKTSKPSPNVASSSRSTRDRDRHINSPALPPQNPPPARSHNPPPAQQIPRISRHRDRANSNSSTTSPSDSFHSANYPLPPSSSAQSFPSSMSHLFNPSSITAPPLTNPHPSLLTSQQAIAQLFSNHPYLASQIFPHVAPQQQQQQQGYPNYGPPGPGGLHQLYTNPLFASLFSQGQHHAQQQQQQHHTGSTPMSLDWPVPPPPPHHHHHHHNHNPHPDPSPPNPSSSTSAQPPLSESWLELLGVIANTATSHTSPSTSTSHSTAGHPNESPSTAGTGPVDDWPVNIFTYPSSSASAKRERDEDDDGEDGGGGGGSDRLLLRDREPPSPPRSKVEEVENGVDGSGERGRRKGSPKRVKR